MEAIPGTDINVAPFPASSKQAGGLVADKQTDATCIYFADKILVTISQDGRLPQWIQVPLLSSTQPSYDMQLPADGADMLPNTHLTPKTLIGAGGENRETIGHLYASQVASIITTRDPNETRTVLVGLGLHKVDMSREAFFDILELVQKVL